jgi:hypothetical protein
MFMALHPLQYITQKPNPTVVRSSLHARVLFFLPAVAFLVHAFFLKIALLFHFGLLPTMTLGIYLFHKNIA